MDGDPLARRQRSVLRIVRLVWSLVLFLVFAIIASMLILGSHEAVPPSRIVGKLALSVLLAWGLLLLAGFLRNQIYKASWHEHAVTPSGYFKGCVTIILGCYLSIRIIGYVFGRTDSPWMGMIFMLPAIVLLLANYPHGRPMRPAAGPQVRGV